MCIGHACLIRCLIRLLASITGSGFSLRPKPAFCRPGHSNGVPSPLVSEVMAHLPRPGPQTLGLGSPQPQLASPATAIHGVLAGRAPPPSLGPPLSAFLAEKADISPQVQDSVIALLKTALSPEEGSLSLESCQEGLERAADNVKGRRLNRKLNDELLAETWAGVYRRVDAMKQEGKRRAAITAAALQVLKDEAAAEAKAVKMAIAAEEALMSAPERLKRQVTSKCLTAGCWLAAGWLTGDLRLLGQCLVAD